MARYRNSGSEPIYFRDDRPEKQVVEPGESFDVVGDQHRAYVETLPGVEAAPLAELIATAEEIGVELPRGRRTKASVAEALDAGVEPTLEGVTPAE